MKINRFCRQYISQCLTLGVIAALSLNVVPVFAQQATETVYFFHLNGPYSDVFDSNNKIIYQQAWNSRGERQTITSASEKELLKQGIPVRYTPRGIKLFDTQLQLTNGGLYSEPLKINP